MIPRRLSALFAVWLLLSPVAARGQDRQAPPPGLGELSALFEELAVRVGPAVVKIMTSGLGVSKEALERGQSVIERQRAAGSGVILDPEGFIATNAHVIEGATRVRVMLAEPSGPGGRSTLRPRGEIVDATVIGIDRETDLAVLKVDREDLPFLEFGDSEALRPGEIVFAFGSPLGLQNSVSMGVVSSVARQLRPEDPMIYIQSDAAVNPGNSGGPLVDTDGKVVGINTLILSQSGGSQGLSFAAPSHIVENIFHQLRRFGRVRRGVIGVRAQTITPTLAAGLRLAQAWGVVLSDVYATSPAAAVGIRPGDIVLGLDGKPMENGRQFDVNVYGRAAGEVVRLEILRGTEILEFHVQVVERPEFSDPFSDQLTGENIVRELGVFAVDLLRVATVLPRTRRTAGVVVAAEAAGATAVPGRFRPGDVLYSVNRQAIDDVAQLRAVLAGLSPGDPVVFHLERGGQLIYVEFEVDW